MMNIERREKRSCPVLGGRASLDGGVGCGCVGVGALAGGGGGGQWELLCCGT